MGPTSSRRRARLRERLLAFLLRPILLLAVTRYLRRQWRPTHDDRAVVVGPRPVRVLVLGAGLAAGRGDDAEALPLPKQLAAALAAELGCGVVVHSRAQATLRLDQTIERIGMAGAAGFDLVIWSPALEESVLGGGAAWSRQLRQLVAHIRATGTRHVRIVLMGVPLAEGTHVLQRIGASLADDVNCRIEHVAAEFDRVQYVSVPPKRINSWDTPLFDPGYQRQVLAGLVGLLGEQHRPAALEGRDGSR